MWTVDIDVGGTLTDGIFTSGDKSSPSKSTRLRTT